MRGSQCLHIVGLIGAVIAIGGCTWFDGLEPATHTPDESDSGIDGSITDAGGDAEGAFDDGGDHGGMDADVSLDADVEPLEDGGRDGGGDVDAAIEEPPLPLDLAWHPEPRRAALTDDSAAQRTQPRVWLLVNGAEDSPHRLVTYAADRADPSWNDTGIWSVESALAAVSYTDDLMQQHQRVMFVRDRKLGVVGFDGDAVVPFADYAAIDGYELEPGGVGALWMHDEARNTDLIAVMAQASKDGVSGYFCVFEQEVGSQFRIQCSDEPLLSTATEIVAAEVRNTPCFFARSAARGVLEVSRLPDDHYVGFTREPPAGHTLDESFAVYPSADQDLADLLAVTEDGRAWLLTIDPDEPHDWEPLPPLPGVAIIRSGQAAIAGLALVQRELDIEYRVPTAIAVGDDGVLYQTSTLPLDTAWRDTWTALPGPQRDQKVFAISALADMVANESSDNMFTAAHAFHVVGGRNGTTLQEIIAEVVHPGFGYQRFDDARPNAALPWSLADVAGAEVSLASGADDALGAIALRGPAPPFSIVLAGSADNASSWHEVAQRLATRPIAGGVAASALDPLTAYSAGLLHLSALEWDLPADCNEPDTRAQRIVYRRAASARALATMTEGDPDLFVVAASERASLDAPAFAVSEGRDGSTAHVLFNDHATGVVRYWRLAPGDDSSPAPLELDPRVFPIGRLELVVSPYDQTVYAVTAYDGRIVICILQGVGVLACSSPPLGDMPWYGGDLPFGEPEDDPQGGCELVYGQHYKCLADRKPFSIAASHRSQDRLLVTYTAADADYTSIYYTMSTGGQGYIGEWSTPVPVHPRTATDVDSYFDAELTVDAQDAVFVTYSSLGRVPNDGVVRSLHAYQNNGFGPFDIGPFLDRDWPAAALPYDCVTRRWALGDYRDADTIDGRSLHGLRAVASGSLRHQTFWLNESVFP